MAKPPPRLLKRVIYEAKSQVGPRKRDICTDFGDFLYILDLSKFYSVLEAVNYNIEGSNDVFVIFNIWSTLVDLLGNILVYFGWRQSENR